MRGQVSAPVATSLADGLPGAYLEGGLMKGLVASLDAAISPVHEVLDSLEAYVDPLVAPSDFLIWLGTWLGARVGEGWAEDRQRDFVSRAHEVYAWRGTVQGVKAALEAYLDAPVDVTDSGGVTASRRPVTDAPVVTSPAMTVLVRDDDLSEGDRRAVDRIVREVKPMHVFHEILYESTSP